MPEFKASRLEEEDPVQARSISSPWISDLVRLAWVTVESKMTARLLHSTIKQEENNKSRGQYKARVLSRYHRPTQNRKKYISSNIIKTTMILNHVATTSTISLAITVKFTHEDSSPNTIHHLGIMFIRLSILTSFKIHYLYSLVSVRDTPLPHIHYSSCVGTWHSDPLILRVGSWHPIPLL